ncbi:putative disease resistance protein RGA4 isoform X2 [Lolium perenne]|uniref:putative disease resistance protein RGA4 isoform X2 n=1 Tax=Lolium perenne TaxID=4522 RepID=UPI0021F6346C|nr:disease resistance protein RGA2-like isoform X2 [Lolium perenne]
MSISEQHQVYWQSLGNTRLFPTPGHRNFTTTLSIGEIKFKMELAMSAVAGELLSRFISFLSNKYHSSQAYSEDKQLEKLQLLLLRACTVVEEADGRYITNSGMLAQLKMLASAMYRGYWALGAASYRSLEEDSTLEVEVSNSSVCPKRSRAVHANARKNQARYLLELQGALESLESIVGNLREFVLILGGCDRMVRRPYDAYLYMENFMFGRHTEKQLLSKFLLQHDHRSPPAVLPIIGALGVGKKTLVAHVCNDERVRSRFPVILHLRESDLLTMTDHSTLVAEKTTLLIIEFVSDLGEKDWSRFYSALASLDSRSKVVILSRYKNSEKFGTVKPIFLNPLSYEEFSYLFKTLTFGSANQLEYPRLVRIADEFARELQSDWSLVTANLLADVIRRDLNVCFWLCILTRLRRVVERNLSMFGEHPKLLLERGHEIAVTDLVLHSSCPLRLVWGITDDVPMKKKPSKVTFHELLIDPGAGRKVESGQLTWESRLPPYTSFHHFVSPCAQGMLGGTTLSRRKRRGVPF